jgi:hypothetical protein
LAIVHQLVLQYLQVTTSQTSNEISRNVDGSHELSVAASLNLVYTFILVRVLSTHSLTHGAPLFKILQEPGIRELRWFLSLIPLGLWLFRRRDDTLLLTAALVNIIYQTCFGYSSVGAFSFAPFYLFVFALVFLRKPSPHLRDEASLLIGLIFLTSAVQKINPLYLTGKEFEMTSPLLSYLHFWNPNLNLLESDLLRRFAAYVSIAVEFAIGFGIFFRPAFFAHLVVLFVLSLSLIHPPILYVYFFFLPLLILIPNGFPKAAIGILSRRGFLLPLALALAIKAITIATVENRNFSYATFTLIVLLFGLHLWVVLDVSRLHRAFLETRIAFFQTSQSFVVPTLLLAFFAGSLSIIPSPLGFNMFAARRYTVASHSLNIDTVEACHFAALSWRFSPVTDSEIEFNETGTCRIRFPTRSGLSAIATKICMARPATIFHQLEDGSTRSIRCSLAGDINITRESQTESPP